MHYKLIVETLENMKQKVMYLFAVVDLFHPCTFLQGPTHIPSVLPIPPWVPPTGVGQEEVLRLLGMAPAHMDGRWRIKAPIPSSLV